MSGLSDEHRESLAEPVYDAYRFGKYGAFEYLPMWHELDTKPVGTPEMEAVYAAVERIRDEAVAEAREEERATAEDYRFQAVHSAQWQARCEKAEAAERALAERIQAALNDAAAVRGTSEPFDAGRRMTDAKVRAALVAVASTDEETGGDRVCACGHPQSDHRNDHAVCQERDRFAPCGCQSFRPRPAASGTDTREGRDDG